MVRPDDSTVFVGRFLWTDERIRVNYLNDFNGRHDGPSSSLQGDQKEVR